MTRAFGDLANMKSSWDIRSLEGVGHICVVCCHFGVEWVIGGHPGGRDAFQEDSLLPTALITLCHDLNDGSYGRETRLEMCGARASLGIFFQWLDV